MPELEVADAGKRLTATSDCADGLVTGPPQQAASRGPEWRSIFPVYVMNLAMVVDDSLVLPSLWGYINELNGGAVWYGLVQAAYYTVRAVSLLLVGWVLDRTPRSYTSVFCSTLALGISASLLYSAAPVLGGVAAVALARSLFGMGSAVGVATMTYVAEHVPPEQRRSAYAVNFGIQRACIPIAPALNLLLVRLPDAQLGLLTLNQYNYTGLLSALLNSLILLSLLLFREPPRQRASTERAAPTPAEVCRTVGRTGAYMSYFLSFQNNWTNHVVLWTMPIITSHLYPAMGTVGNSVLLASGGFTALVTAFSTPRLFKGVPDRRILLLAQLCQGATILPFVLIFGCGTGHPPLWCYYVIYDLYSVAFMAQMPANNAIYTKLIGAQGQGVYMSLLEISKALARIFAGLMIGTAYAALGPCFLWSITMGIWSLQFVPFLANWSRLDVESRTVL